MADSRPDRAGHGVIAPVAASRLRIGCEIGSDHVARQTFENRKILAGPLHAWRDWLVMLGPIMRRVAIHTDIEAFGQVLPTRQTFRGAFKYAAGQWTGSGTNKWTPADRRGNPDRENDYERHSNTTRKIFMRQKPPPFIYGC